ncbi:unnamed protein product, partial [Mesorhabditis belari]|uniref:C-type LECtin n=1 Tax=Mesorhabditis belari TaxID=2138241 RepID=A0AAF3EIC0_9BILA
MLQRLFIPAVLFTIALSQQTTPSSDCPSDFVQFRNKCYKLFQNQGLTWAQSEATCNDLGGNLVSIHDNETDNFILQYTRQQYLRTAAWIGVKNPGTGVYWSDNTAVDFKNFAPAQDNPPICFGFSVVDFYYPGQWIPQSCSAIMSFICEKPLGVPPTTVNPFTCGAPTYFGNNGTIQSPGYPQVFHKVDCSWQINAFNNFVNIEFPPIKASGYWYLDIYTGTTRDYQNSLYSTTNDKPFNETLKISSPTPQMLVRLLTDDPDDINPFEFHYSGTDSPLYVNPTPPSRIMKFQPKK